MDHRWLLIVHDSDLMPYDAFLCIPNKYGHGQEWEEGCLFFKNRRGVTVGIVIQIFRN